ncbi:hypothetical protein OESDEN_22445 [Oesophagostomum dentatum]|uniref:Uncharacterized protein n=1 Tax=Oesophagostomum dentatum TaxID=61180 RepID=A0A0B1S3W8_OESDE|nr:hypothetical protein OESDEN_22445 [Oesophagostomum dentatum]
MFPIRLMRRRSSLKRSWKISQANRWASG